MKRIHKIFPFCKPSDSTNKIYRIGYLGRTAEQMREIVGDGMLLDIRIYPQSRKKGFGKKALTAMFGDRYLWLYEFGNKSETAGKVELWDPRPGVAIVKRLRKTADGNLFLMCACRNGATCHRHTVGELLATKGIETEEYAG